MAGEDRVYGVGIRGAGQVARQHVEAILANPHLRLAAVCSRREESAEQFLKGGSPERAAQERAEITVLQAYLPAMLEGVQLEAAVREAIADAGATSKKDIGAVMKQMQARHAGRFDGRSANQLIQTLLP